jgi:hypothetical protein
LKIEDVKLIWESELSELVTKTYGRPYSLQQQDEMMAQDTILRVRVPEGLEPWNESYDENPEGYTPLPTLARWAATETPAEHRFPSYREEMWWHRNFYPCRDEVLGDLHDKGLLPAGDYVIHCWW